MSYVFLNVSFQMLSSPSPSSSGQLSQLGASLYGPQSECYTAPHTQQFSSQYVAYWEEMLRLDSVSMSVV